MHKSRSRIYICICNSLAKIASLMLYPANERIISCCFRSHLRHHHTEFVTNMTTCICIMQQWGKTNSVGYVPCIGICPSKFYSLHRKKMQFSFPDWLNKLKFDQIYRKSNIFMVINKYHLISFSEHCRSMYFIWLII